MLITTKTYIYIDTQTHCTQRASEKILQTRNMCVFGYRLSGGKTRKIFSFVRYLVLIRFWDAYI